MIFLLALLFSVLPTSSEAVASMINSLYLPENHISVEGTTETGERLLLEFDKKKGEFIKTIGDEKQQLSFDEMPVFLKLFFFSGEKNAETPDFAQKKAAEILKILEGSGIKSGLSTWSANDESGNVSLVIGKAKRFEGGSFLELSKRTMRPVKLQIGDETYIFSDYHRSVNPLVFPGRIEHLKNGQQVAQWLFLRKEFR